MSEVTFESAVTWSGEGVSSVAKCNGNEFVMDEPPALGGKNKGPNPAETLLSALGGCLNVMVVTFAKQYQVEIRALKSVVEGNLNPDGFLEKTPGIRPGFQQIRYRMEIETPTPSEQVQALIQHVERVCPMKDTLTGVPTIKLEHRVVNSSANARDPVGAK